MNNNRKWVLIITFIGLLIGITSGCSTQPVKWYKPGASASVFAKDKADCEAALVAGGEAAMTIPPQVYTLEGCLKYKGWQALVEDPYL
jgi:hypothetical protein